MNTAEVGILAETIRPDWAQLWRVDGQAGMTPDLLYATLYNDTDFHLMQLRKQPQPRG